jgi:hypothetical protein
MRGSRYIRVGGIWYAFVHVNWGICQSVQLDRVVKVADRPEHGHVGQTDEEFVDLDGVSLERGRELAGLRHRRTLSSPVHGLVDPNPPEIR